MPLLDKDAASKPGSASFFQSGSFYLLGALAIIDGADTQLLPASYRALEADLGFSLHQLLLLTAMQGVTMSLSGPFWASLADNGAQHRLLLSLGAFGWGTCTIALAFCNQFWLVLALRAVVGFFLGTLVPVIQSMVAQGAPRGDRGRAFGSIDMAQKLLGQACAGIIATSTSNKLVMGYRGWRFNFLTIGVLSIALAGLVLYLMEDSARHFTPEKVSPLSELRKLIRYMRIKSFVVLIAQGMLGSIPWVTLSSATLYFQYVGMSDTQAGLAFSMNLFGCGAGSVMGGWLGDWWAAWSPYHGRPLVAQVSVFLGMPIAIVIFAIVPAQPWTFQLQACLCFALGLVSSWCQSGCNRPIFVDIVPSHDTASVVAWDEALEMGFASSAGNFMMSVITHAFGYYSQEVAGMQVADLPQEVRHANAEALGGAILFTVLVFWSACFLLFSLLHITYKADYEAIHGC